MRGMINYVKKKFSKPIVGVEIGVQYGVNAVSILSSMPNLKLLYLVDPYKSKGFDHIRNNAVNTLSVCYRDRVCWHFCKSTEAVKHFADESMDFVYIDGSHVYPDVKKDIELWYPKVKPNGVIGGHDYIEKAGDAWVARAVDEWVDTTKKELFLRENPQDWWVNK